MSKRSASAAIDDQIRMVTSSSSHKMLDDTDPSCVYGDPTYDMTFKMLFGSEQNKDLLVSILNSLLNFTGTKEIDTVEINDNNLSPESIVIAGVSSEIRSAIDIVCTNRNKEIIAIEMQGQRTDYFLTREQFYMAKLISRQVKQGEGKLHHKKILETYIIVIGKENIFHDKTALIDQTLYEIYVRPVVLQTGEVVPDNRIFWKFFELKKFSESSIYESITKSSPLKEQWLEFLIDCSNQTEAPDRNEIIKKGYEIMKVKNWTPLQCAQYEHQQDAAEDLRLTIEAKIAKEGRDKYLEGKLEGKLKGEIKGEIKMVKGFLKYNVPKANIVQDLKFLTDPKVLENLDNNLDYIRQHNDETDSLICEELGLMGALFGVEASDTVGMSG